MGIIRTILLVAFVIISILLILLVLIQNENSNGMGTAFGGGQSAAFGSHSASVLTRTTGVLVGLFLLAVFLLAFLNRGVLGDSGLSNTAIQVQEGLQDSSARSSSWIDDEESTSIEETSSNAQNQSANQAQEAVQSDAETEETSEIPADGVYSELPDFGR